MSNNIDNKTVLTVALKGLILESEAMLKYINDRQDMIDTDGRSYAALDPWLLNMHLEDFKKVWVTLPRASNG